MNTFIQLVCVCSWSHV